MVWIAVVLAVFLFYKFVERQHKIVFFKVAGILVVIGLLGIGGFLGYERLSEEPHNAGIRIFYSYHSSKLPNERRIQIANKIFDKYKSREPLLQYFTLEEQDFMKNLFYEQASFESKIHNQYVNSAAEEIDLDFEAFVEKDPTKLAKNKKRRIELASIRLDKHLVELPELRESLGFKDKSGKSGCNAGSNIAKLNKRKFLLTICAL